ncbi:unnamed protein product [Trifolium pratense]|uniref:Uncharacterized protein n=1 Tax=Trifolium pratense TaxID=57577 RepID=A0ACB0KPX9_TRIPR|nr:unnamed protein product [Trifolium pratense]
MCGNPCKATGVKAEEILVESTGVIGQRINKMSGNTGKRKDNPTSSGDLDPMALYNRRNQSAVIMEPGSILRPPTFHSYAREPSSTTFRPATFNPPYQLTFQSHVQEPGCTPPALDNKATLYSLGTDFA